MLSYAWQYLRLEREAQDMAALRGRLVFDMISMARSWNSKHGAVYAPITGDTPPNPYLEQPEKIIQTPSGRMLTLINPAYMTRQMSGLLAQRTDLRIHLTSLKPINPGNAPDPWERESLMRFDAGAKEAVSIDQGVFRYMAPLMVEKDCLRCHAAQGYRVYQVRGGLSVTQPASYISNVIDAQRESLLEIHLAAFVLLSILSLSSLRMIRRHVLGLARERNQRAAIAEALANKVGELEKTRDELVHSEKMASLGRMVAGFAHEVNTPVGVAVGAASHIRESITAMRRLLAQDEVQEEDLEAKLDVMEEASGLTLAHLSRAAQLVRNFKRTSIDISSNACREFYLAKLIEDILGHLRLVFKHDPVRIEVQCEEGLKLYGPAGAVEQILTNLLMNTRLHGFDEGRRKGRIQISASASDTQVRLRYSDDGAGMEAEVVERVFEPFFSTCHGRGGSGLGLYIVYTLATQTLGGTITCNSAPEQGAVFDICFPLHVEVVGQAYGAAL
jgi:signal transduction histidine kinase